MMLIVNMVQGSFMATIAEGLTLAQVTGQSQQTLLDILNQGQLASIFLDQKCQSKSPLISSCNFVFNRAEQLGQRSSWRASPFMGHCVERAPFPVTPFGSAEDGMGLIFSAGNFHVGLETSDKWLSLLRYPTRKL